MLIGDHLKLHRIKVFFLVIYYIITLFYGGRRGRDRMVVGFTTTYAISAYHH